MDKYGVRSTFLQFNTDFHFLFLRFTGTYLVIQEQAYVDLCTAPYSYIVQFYANNINISIQFEEGIPLLLKSGLNRCNFVQNEYRYCRNHIVRIIFSKQNNFMYFWEFPLHVYKNNYKNVITKQSFNFKSVCFYTMQFQLKH